MLGHSDSFDDLLKDYHRVVKKKKKLEKQVNELLAAFRPILVTCDWVHHTQKDLHKLGEPCPVVDRIIETIKKIENDE
jgi:hypothetical protein